jgi:hypothetical protein
MTSFHTSAKVKLIEEYNKYDIKYELTLYNTWIFTNNT